MTPDVLALLQGLTEQQKKLCVICSSASKRNWYGLPILVRPWRTLLLFKTNQLLILSTGLQLVA